MRAVAVITKPEVVEKILSHLRLPLWASLTADELSVRYEVDRDEVPDWVAGVDPEPCEPCERGPPSDWDGVDPPSPDE